MSDLRKWSHLTSDQRKAAWKDAVASSVSDGTVLMPRGGLDPQDLYVVMSRYEANCTAIDKAISLNALAEQISKMGASRRYGGSCANLTEGMNLSGSGGFGD